MARTTPTQEHDTGRAKANTTPEATLTARAMEVYRRLLATYGEHELRPRRAPMHELLSTMLSHRTTQKNEALAYTRMMEHFGSYQAVESAPTNELAETIAQANFPGAKAANIQKTLARIIRERGAANIDFLQDLPADEGLAWLMSLPGVGIKTASLVLLFDFAKPVMPVDTHVHRVSQRIGLIGPKVTAEKAHQELLALLPPDPHVLYNFHVDMLRHGQKVCIWGTPRCQLCPLTDLCDWYETHRAPDAIPSA
ncbi:MAG TPA: endonuclease III [Trueperaceae bacterium]